MRYKINTKRGGGEMKHDEAMKLKRGDQVKFFGKKRIVDSVSQENPCYALCLKYSHASKTYINVSHENVQHLERV